MDEDVILAGAEEAGPDGTLISVKVEPDGSFIVSVDNPRHPLDSLPEGTYKMTVTIDRAGLVVKENGFYIIGRELRTNRRAGRNAKELDTFRLWRDDGSDGEGKPEDWYESPVELDRIRELGVSEAARRLKVSRPTVYRHIKKLEEDCN